MFITGGTIAEHHATTKRDTLALREMWFVYLNPFGMKRLRLRCPLCLSELECCAAFDSGLVQSFGDC